MSSTLTQDGDAPIYLDHNATTPLDPAVVEAMLPYYTARFGNPSSTEHRHGLEAAQAVERAREQIAQLIGARSNEVTFTGNCTESNNLALLGFAEGNPEKRHIITSSIEHPSVLEPARRLQARGWELTILPVGADGVVDPADVDSAVNRHTGLVSIMAANNEIGTIQRVGEIGAVCAGADTCFHSDLTQLLASGVVDVQRDNIHLASLSAHKLYGPKGIGALYVRSRRPRVRIEPVLYGGGQERGLRPGTLNVPLIVGFGEAASIAKKRAERDRARLMDLCDQFLRKLRDALSGVELNGHPRDRLPMLSLSMDGIEPLALLRRIRSRISISASSACASDKIETSHVLMALYGDSKRARQAFRVAPGRFTSQADMLRAADHIIDAVQKLRVLNQ